MGKEPFDEDAWMLASLLAEVGDLLQPVAWSVAVVSR
jgi:hypothetical protein